MPTVRSLIRRLQDESDPAAVAGMAAFGIRAERALGISMPVLRTLAREVGLNHTLADALWKTGIHEARILASLIDDPDDVTPEQMERWTGDFNSWDLCDQCCLNLFSRTPYAYRKAASWAARPEEFVKRAGFSLMACLAVHDTQAQDSQYRLFLTRIRSEAGDQRNFVRKAINWALRQIGKRNPALNRLAIDCAVRIQQDAKPGSSWVASDALRELRSPAVRRRLRARAQAVHDRRRRFVKVRNG